MSQRVWLYITTIVVGLWISATGAAGLFPDGVAEWPVNIWCWGVFAYVYRMADKKERIEMVAVVALATPMELFFSEVFLCWSLTFSPMWKNSKRSDSQRNSLKCKSINYVRCLRTSWQETG